MSSIDPFDLPAEDYSVDREGGKWVHRPHIVPYGPSIIVIGPDGVGKTTVANTISELYKIPTFKFPAEADVFRKGQNGQLLFDLGLAHFLRQTKYRFISDRGYPCEWVYSKVFGRETDHGLLSEIDRRHRDLNTKILYLYASVQPSEPDELVPAEFYWKVKGTYDGFCDWTECRVYKVDTSESLHLQGDERRLYEAKHCLRLMGMID